MNNIFEGAKFGDKFLTRKGFIAIYHFYDTIADRHYLINPKYLKELSYRSDGTCSLDYKGAFNYDIVSRYKKSIDEKKLNEDANKEWINKDYVAAILPSKADDTKFGYILGFEDGYHKAMED